LDADGANIPITVAGSYKITADFNAKTYKVQTIILLINLKEAVPFIETASFFLKKSVLVFCKIDILFDFINSTSFNYR
jgi:cell division protein FtsB